MELDDEVVIQLVDTASKMTTMLSTMTGIHDLQDEKLSVFKDQLLEVRESLRHIAKILLEGNGDKPLLARTAILEEKVDRLEEDWDDFMQHEEILRKEELIRSRISRKGKWTLAVAVVSGIAGIVVSLIAYFT